MSTFQISLLCRGEVGVMLVSTVGQMATASRENVLAHKIEILVTKQK